VGNRFALRACIVNFRTSLADIEALPPLLARIGREVELSLGG
jgi:aromatic-L-amino-acid decarboxylase